MNLHSRAQNLLSELPAELRGTLGACQGAPTGAALTLLGTLPGAQRLQLAELGVVDIRHGCMQMTRLGRALISLSARA